MLMVQGTTRVDSINISQSMQDVSPDRVFDFEAASRRAATPEEAQALQALSEKLQAEIQVLASFCEQSQPCRLLLCQSLLPHCRDVCEELDDSVWSAPRLSDCHKKLGDAGVVC